MKINTAPVLLAAILGYVATPAVASFRRQAPYSCTLIANDRAYDAPSGGGVRADVPGGWYTQAITVRNLLCPYLDDSLFPRQSVAQVLVDFYVGSPPWPAGPSDARARVAACVQNPHLIAWACGPFAERVGTLGYVRLSPDVSLWTNPEQSGSYAYLHVVLSGNARLMGYLTTL
jgi:hypothetical protein